MTDQILDHPEVTVPSGTSGGDATPAEGLASPRPRASIGRRVGDRLARPFVRTRRWMEAPWPIERVIRVLTGIIIVGGATFAAVRAVHPALIFEDNTPTGGDMGAHVMGPAYLRDHLLPELQLNGWSNYWYSGFPIYRFYMVIPALMIVALNVVFPYGIAFKIVVVLGIVTLPLCCWAFGRLARFRYPMPELFGLAGMLFLFDESFSIYGGNVKSTMAGEFSFSIALSLGMLGLGLFARGLETGRYRSCAAIVIALSCLSHGIVLIFVMLGAFLLWLVWMDSKRIWFGVTTVGTAVLLMAFWVVPFLLNHQYMTDMKYGFRPQGADDSFWDMFFPLTTFFDIFITTFACIGFVASIVKRHLNGAWLGICSLALVALVYVTRDSLPVIQLLWNPRLLPFIYLLRYILMMVGIVETATLVARAMRNERELVGVSATYLGAAVAGIVGLSVLVIELMFFRVMPGAGFQTHNGKSVYQWGPIALTHTSTDALSDAWSRYNFTGYEDKRAYGEYKALVDTMASLGEDPEQGCGRALWENNSENGQYGTTMALMLLPHWTDGCIASMEGLFFEASGTTPYHFVTAAAMSESSSNPVRELRYDNNSAAIGVPYLQTLGVKYVMVFTQAAKNQAELQPELTPVADSGPWRIYSVAGSGLVEPLAVQPVVVNPRGGDQRERNLELGMSWFQHREEWAAIPADDGPETWQRIDVSADVGRVQEGRVDIVQPVGPIEVVDLPDVTVSNVDLGEQDLSFDVDRVGVPILVKISYFPNWEVSGAEGPYRIAPNLMVVIPTDEHVELTFERSGVDVLAYLLTLIGIGLLVLWRVRGDAEYDSPVPGEVVERDGAGDSAPDPLAGPDPLARRDPLAVPGPHAPPADDELWGRTTTAPETTATEATATEATATEATAPESTAVLPDATSVDPPPSRREPPDSPSLAGNV